MLYNITERNVQASIRLIYREKGKGRYMEKWSSADTDNTKRNRHERAAYTGFTSHNTVRFRLIERQTDKSVQRINAELLIKVIITKAVQIHNNEIKYNLHVSIIMPEM